MADTGQRVGDYEVLAPLGAGGMGRVYKVRNVISNREEAMKILLPDFAADPELAARFMAEIRTLAGLEHPGIAQLRTAFQYNNQFVMVMEFVEGATLDKIAAQAPIPIDKMLDYAAQALAALSYAHSRGVTHRDIKPANIMITSHGLVKLMDFGIAKSTGDMQLTRPGTTMGSVYYMSPEQVRGGAVDARSDIYSFGVTLYEMLTGRKPFQADTTYSVLNAQLNQAPQPLQEVNPVVSLELSGIVLHAMAKVPDDRFQTADEFRNALKALWEAQTAPAAAGVAAAAPASVWQTPASVPAQPPTPVPAYAAPPAAPSMQSVAQQPPPFTPVPPAPMPPAGAAKSHRGLWIAIGAATALLALVLVGTLLPRMFSTRASQKPTTPDTSNPPAATTPSTPSSSPQQTASAANPADTPPSQNPGDAGQPAGTSTSGTPAKSGSSKPGGTSGQTRPPYTKPGSGNTPAGSTAGGTPSQGSGSGTSNPPAASAGPSPRDVRDAHDRYANLEARADAAIAGVQQIRSQQQAQGLDIRGDILASMNRLHHQLNEAQRALDGRDLDTANLDMNRADEETTRLEKFLGR